METIHLKQLEIIGNNPSLLQSPLQLKLSYQCNDTTIQDHSKHRWEFEYMVDVSSSRHVVQLGTTHSIQKLDAAYAFEFTIPSEQLQQVIEQVESVVLNNTGLLMLKLFTTDVLQFQLNMVVLIERKSDGFWRTILNPLES